MFAAFHGYAWSEEESVRCSTDPSNDGKFSLTIIFFPKFEASQLVKMVHGTANFIQTDYSVDHPVYSILERIVKFRWNC